MRLAAVVLHDDGCELQTLASRFFFFVVILACSDVASSRCLCITEHTLNVRP